MNGCTPASRWNHLLEEYRGLLDRPLMPWQAQRLDELATRLGKRLAWYHIDLSAGRDEPWQPGRIPRK